MKRSTRFGCGTRARVPVALITAICLVACIGRSAEPPRKPVESVRVRRLLTAIATVESQNDPDVVGDGGRAIGPYQIHQAYWRDSGIRGHWTDCRNAAYARRVVLAYWAKHTH